MPNVAHAANSQYDDDSAPNEAWNCGPTTVTNVIRYQKGVDYPINATRRLATSSYHTGTNLSERKVMFEKRGVAASIHHLAYSDMKRRLDGTRTIELPVLMSEIPLSVRGRPFPGSHSVEALCNAVVNGVSGVYINNPDFHEERHERSRYFIPDRYLKQAYDALGSFCTIPDHSRVMPSRVRYVRKCRTTATVRLRSGPSTKHSIVHTAPHGFSFTSLQLEKIGGTYLVDGRTHRDWLSLNYQGRVVWVARGYTKEI